MKALKHLWRAVALAWKGAAAGFASVYHPPVGSPTEPLKRDEPKKAKTALLGTTLRQLIAAMKRPSKETISDRSMWTSPKPPPGVLPEGGKLAMDATISDITAWAQAGSLFDEGLTFLGYPYLAQLAQRPEYRMVSETWAQEMTRRWIRLTSTGNGEIGDKSGKLVKLEAALKRYKVRESMRQVGELDGFFGRAHLYVDLGTGDDREELQTSIGGALRKAKVRKGSLRGFRVVEPVWTYPNAYNANDPLKADFFRPETWFVMGKEVHATRLLTFVGRPVPDLLKPAYSFGGLSMSQMAKPYVDNWLRTRQSVSDAVSNFSITVLLTDLATYIQEGAAVDLANRADLFNETRDNRGLFIGDKNTEDVRNVSMPLGGLHELQAQSQEQMCAVSGIPSVKLLGITPQGFNASSEGEIKVFYDKVSAQQPAFYGDNLKTVIELVQLSEFGEIDPEIGYVWEPLDTLNAGEEATRRKTEADTDVMLIDAGVISPEEARTRLASDDESPYASLDLSDEALPALPEGEEGVDPNAQQQENDRFTGDEAIRAAGVLFVADDGSALLLRRSADDERHPGAWDLPGGRVEPGETAQQAACREAMEETEREVFPDDLTTLSTTKDSVPGVTYTMFLVRVPDRFEPKLSDEHSDSAWVTSAPEGTLAPLADVLSKLFDN